ncbi:MAG: FAD-dependent oxidoreductase, partial [Pseudomonadota bacterium]
MIVSGDTFLTDAPTRHFDVAIVGAGTVGLCLASALRKAGVSVVLLEAGGASANASSNHDTAISAGHPHEGTEIGRAAGLGGTSTLWAGQLVEFDPPDLQRDGSAWPISYATLAGWYKKTYSALGVGPRPPLSAYQDAMGFQVDPDDTVEPLVTRWLSEPNFARIFSQDVKSDIPIITGVEADKITFDGARAVAISG